MIKNHKIILFYIFISCFLTLFFISELYANSQKSYFVSLRSSKTNVRSGPSTIYPVKFTYKLRSIPLTVINEYDNWNEIRDYEGQTGWISKNLLSKNRTLMIRTNKKNISMHSKQNEKSRIIYKLENNVIGNFVKCSKEWCKIEIDDKLGWVKKRFIYGY